MALGWPHPDILLGAITTEQLGDWAEFYNREPWGFEVEDLRHGVLASTIARGAGAKKVGPKDFMLRPPEEEPEDPAAAAAAFFGVKLPKRPK